IEIVNSINNRRTVNLNKLKQPEIKEKYKQEILNRMKEKETITYQQWQENTTNDVKETVGYIEKERNETKAATPYILDKDIKTWKFQNRKLGKIYRKIRNGESI